MGRRQFEALQAVALDKLVEQEELSLICLGDFVDCHAHQGEVQGWSVEETSSFVVKSGALTRRGESVQ